VYFYLKEYFSLWTGGQTGGSKKGAGGSRSGHSIYHMILGASFKTLSLIPTDIANMFYESEFYDVDRSVRLD